MRPNRWCVLAGLAAFSATCPAADLGFESPAPGPQTKFERVVIDANFPGAYQVEVADVNGDGKPDIVALGGSTLAWYENPTWTKRVVSTAKEAPDVISSATADLDGDGKAEIAIAYDFSMNEPRRGKLLLAVQGEKTGDPWTFRPIVGKSYHIKPDAQGRLSSKNVDQELAEAFPSIHRLRWGIYPSGALESQRERTYARRPGLFVAPIFGPSARPPIFNQEPARFVVLDPGPAPKSGLWGLMPVGSAPVLHAIEVIDLGDGGYSAVLGASNLGVTSFRFDPDRSDAPLYRPSQLAPGAPGESPKKGASEVHLGKFKDGRKFLATVEPWHGTDVAIYESESLKPLKFGPRAVIDSTLKEGHALWVADVDGDGDDEVFAGYRAGGGGILMFDLDGKTWGRSVLDPDVAAQDLRGGDLDGDGRPDIVAVGGRTHNVVWYRPAGPRPEAPAPR